MKKILLLFAVFASVIFSNAGNKFYKFDNMFSIRVSDKLELRSDSDDYTKFVKDSLKYSAKANIIFQPKGLSNREPYALNHFCRIMIINDRDESCPYPLSNDRDFSYDDYKVFQSIADSELGPNKYVKSPTVEIKSTSSGAVYFLVNFVRTGIKGNVNVDLCFYFNNDCMVKTCHSYRESDSIIWKSILNDAMNSFEWIESDSIPTANVDSISDKEQHSTKDTRGWIIIICLLCFGIGVFTYILIKSKPNNQFDNHENNQNFEITKDDINESTLDSKTEGILDFEEDKAGCLGLGFSFVFPMIGIVLYFYQKESVSNPSSYLIAALLGFICGMTFNVLLSAL